MFKGQRRGGFMVATPLNTPIVMHKIGKAKHVSKDEILSFLDKFIAEKESLEGITNTPATTEVSNTEDNVTTTTSISAINIDTNLSSAISQLKRIQRDFKGLPPQSFTPVVPAVTNVTETVTETTEHGEETITKSATGGKKVTFDE